MNDQLSSTFFALSDPTRRAILARLSEGEATVGELAAPFSVSLPAISRHLKVLERAALITRRKDAQWRRCALSADPLQNATEWLTQYRRFWEGQFDQLEQYLSDVKQRQRGESHGTNGNNENGR